MSCYWSFNERRCVVRGNARAARECGRGAEEGVVLRVNAALGSRRAGHPCNPSARQTAPQSRGERARTNERATSEDGQDRNEWPQFAALVLGQRYCTLIGTR